MHLTLRCLLGLVVVVAACGMQDAPRESQGAAQSTALGFDCDSGCRGTTTQLDATTTVYRIDQPDVRNRWTTYPAVQFLPGDLVTVRAGGCVQTGGGGDTWKRYVDPRGEESWRLYLGWIDIPGAVGGVPFQYVNGRTFRVPGEPGPAPAPVTLRLGYTDDDYSDNGYYSHDDGDGQCRYADDGGPAWVELTVQRGVEPVTAAKATLCGQSSHQEPCTQIAVTNLATGATDYLIFQPVVSESEIDYPVVLERGDVVRVSAAGGCVQTGGGGDTWKLYEDPDHAYELPPPPSPLPLPPVPFDPRAYLYQGTIHVPGASSGTLTVYDGERRDMVVPTFEPVDPACSRAETYPLLLGYKDDEYGDNGYYKHDDGTGGQCRGVGPAWLVVHVEHEAARPFTANADWDLVPACLDHNYVFFNPRWNWQEPGRPDYPHYEMTSVSSQTTHHDFPASYKRLANLVKSVCDGGRGHRNWMATTYTGTVWWENWSNRSSPLFSDDDYNITFVPAQPIPGIGGYDPPFRPGGLNEDGHRDNILLEFDSDETVDEFDDTYWQHAVQSAVDDSDSAARLLLDGRFAVVMGLYGMDEAHGAGRTGNEIHPVHVLAIRMSAQIASGQLVEHWAIFARNWGNEGGCGDGDHYLDLRDITIRLPPSAAVSGPATVTASDMRPEGPSSWDVFASREGARDLFVTFHLPTPDQHGWMAGDMTVAWSTTATAVPPLADADARAIGNRLARGKDEDDGEGFERLWEALTPAQLADAAAIHSRIAPPPHVAKDRPSVPPLVLTAPPPRPPPVVPTVSVGPPTQRFVDRRNASITALCAVTGGRPLPGDPPACSGFPPVTLIDLTGGVMGKNGWLVVAPTITLTARDVSGAGVAAIEWSLDGVAWTPYTGPFTAPEGDYVLRYRSRDNASNLEQTREQPLRVDTRRPSATATTIAGAGGTTFVYQITDPAPGSGPAGIHTRVRGATDGAFTPGASGTIRLATTCSAVEYWAEDVAGNEQTPHAFTPDLDPPSLSLQPADSCLWPPNHRRVRLRLGSDITATGTDACDPQPAVRIVAVTSNEPVDGRGDGSTAPDVAFSDGAVCVRRERSGTGTGRVYTLTVEARDASGNATRRAATLRVPHGGGAGCVAGNTIGETEECR